ncbi:hypothetical protein [Streptomyces sp. YIM 98790]|uniref:DUF3592 domain-containing protein n=1 Tax=Streptomyces sp. YIM 98790 TaxID=2689077 RepID=UPI001407B5B7|nr:hypothetical protein [Streptomyces sp. YIM 98790]
MYEILLRWRAALPIRSGLSMGRMFFGLLFALIVAIPARSALRGAILLRRGRKSHGRCVRSVSNYGYFEYAVDGQKYVQKIVSFENFHRGQVIEVLYDPQRPRRCSAVGSNGTLGHVIFYAGAALVAAILAGSVYSSL